MIYDSFLFYNEFELLELRLRELSGIVDRFVIAESRRTHSNQSKPLHFAANRDRFRAFDSRITHVVVEDDPAVLQAWRPTGRARFAIEDHDRRCLSRALAGCRPDDIILTGDVDEIPRADSLRAAVAALRYRDHALARLWSGFLRMPIVVQHGRALLRKWHPRVTVFEQRMFYYFLNLACVDRPWWTGTRMVFHRDFTSAYDLRRWGGRRWPDAGWHFSYMGGVERIRAKLAAYAHTEYNRPEFTDPVQMARRLGRGEDVLGTGLELGWVPLDDTFPRSLREDPGPFASWIGPPPDAKPAE